MTTQSPRKILWIDDVAQTHDLGRIILENSGFIFLSALDGQSGLEMAEREQPDLILLDYAMRGMNGRDVLEAMIATGPDNSLYHIPVIMLTGYGLPEEERRGMLQRGLYCFLKKPFGHRELLDIIENVLTTSGIQRHNRLLERELKDAFASIVCSLISLLAAKDEYTGEHSGVVLKLSELVARKCGLDDDLIMDVGIAALLHDIGKIGVPESILCKPAKLTPEEKASMDKHVEFGYQALENIPRLSRVREMVYHHHEWWDGGGYPQKLARDEINIGGRIVAVVDAWDAMTSDRPYRRGMDHAVALQRLHAASGTQFDPWVVAQFTDCVNEGIPGIHRSENLSRIITEFNGGPMRG
ncbi:MAG: HD domain-containing phosphohydrolase [Blastocatellia bacterium]